MYYIETDVTGFRPSQGTEPINICMCTSPHIYTLIFISISMHVFLKNHEFILISLVPILNASLNVLFTISPMRESREMKKINAFKSFPVIV